jgi:hypothetical protein
VARLVGLRDRALIGVLEGALPGATIRSEKEVPVPTDSLS